MSPAERRAFFVSRLARLYPAYLLAFVLVAPFALERWAGGGSVAAAKAAMVAAASLLLLQAWATPIARIWNTPGWSTSVVAAFYVAFPALAARLSRLSRRGLALAALAAWASGLALALAYLSSARTAPCGSDVARAVLARRPQVPPPRARGRVLAGVALGLLHRRGSPSAAPAAPPRRARSPRRSRRSPGVARHTSSSTTGSSSRCSRSRSSGSRAAGASRAGARSRPARALGDASFALYALQEPLWLWSRSLLSDGRARPRPPFVAGYALFAVAVSVAVSRTLERPARRALRSLLGERTRCRPSPPSGSPSEGARAAAHSRAVFAVSAR